MTLRQRRKTIKHTFKGLERADIDLAKIGDLWRSAEPESTALWTLDFEIQYDLFNPFTADVTIWGTTTVRRRDD
jgi:hypothetical protein